jgi:glycosyltransferase involved in cell wall biosynthesis
MGGFYYHLKQPKKLFPIISKTGIFTKFDKILDSSSYNFSRINLIHLNKANGKLTDAALLTEIPKIFTFHGSIDLIHIRNALSSICEMLNKIAEKATFVAVSQHAADTIAKYCNIRSIVIHNGVDVTIFNPTGC